MLQTYNSDIDELIMLFYNDSVKVVKIQHVIAKLHRIISTKVTLCLQINENKTPPFSFQLNLILTKCTKHH